MAKKEFTYRGKNLQELQSLDLKALAAVFPAPSRRKEYCGSVGQFRQKPSPTRIVEQRD